MDRDIGRLGSPRSVVPVTGHSEERGAPVVGQGTVSRTGGLEMDPLGRI